MRAAPRSPATRAAESARCAHSRSATSSGSKKSDSAESLDDGGTAGTVKLFSEAAPALAPRATEESEMRANTRAKSVRCENKELREQMEALRVSLEAEVTRADAASVPAVRFERMRDWCE